MLQEKPHQILVVDDDEDIRDSLRAIFEGEGYVVATASNGLEALDYLRSMPAPCAIVLDLMMPVMSGWQFCAERRRDPLISKIPVVVMTAARRAAGEPTDLSVSVILEKPLDIEKIIETVALCRMNAA